MRFLTEERNDRPEQSLQLTNKSSVFYHAAMSSSTERFEVALNTPAGRVTAVLDVAIGFVPVTSIVPVARRLGEDMLKLEEARVREQGEPVSCQMGCAACCRMLVPLSPPEAFALRDYVAGLPAERQDRIRSRIDEIDQRLISHGLASSLREIAETVEAIPDEELDPVNRAYYALRLPCPFLENEICSIYEARPAACRELLVTSPASFCDDMVNNQVVPVPVGVRIGTVLGLLWSTIKSEPPRLIPLPMALEWAERHAHEASQRWSGAELIDLLLDKIWRVLSHEFQVRGQTPPS